MTAVAGAIALIVGTVVAGQTFYLFTLENLKQFGALKAIGVSNWRLTRMVVLQALTVGGIGFHPVMTRTHSGAW